jgi:hypothetical protein
MSDLQGKKILLIAPVFFGYENHIRSELMRRGAIVDFLPDRPFSSPMLKALIRFAPILIDPFSNFFYKKKFAEKRDHNYDYLFVIQGESIGQSTLERAKQLFPNAFTMLYLWDSIANKKSAKQKIQLFNQVFSFDRSDAKAYGITYRPLFFVDADSPRKSSYKYLMSFIGTAHSDRYKICKEVRQVIPKGAVSFFYLYLQAPWVFFARKVMKSSFWRSSIKEFEFKPLSKDAVDRIFENSFSVLDIEHPNQRGLTMRTFEVLVKGKKLVTTNSTIKNEDFYHPNNVYIINRGDDIHLNHDFFDNPFIPLPITFYEKYSLKGWIDEIFHQT